MIFWRDYAALARWDRPIGAWLLLLPCWWGMLLGLHLSAMDFQLSHVLYIIYFAIGAFLMRGAGCVWNDILDRKADAEVERTRERPLAAGRLSVRQAMGFICLQVLLALVILLQFPIVAIVVALCSLFLVILYPLMKRVTYWPQAWLGLTFNWGVWVGGFVIIGDFSSSALLPLGLLYGAGIFWTLGYDTVYAMQDRIDDARVGVKSTALLFGDSVVYWVGGFYFICHILLGVVGWLFVNDLWFWIFWVLGGVHLVWQYRCLRKTSPDYGKLFKSNRDYGLLVVLGLGAGLV